MKADIHGDVAPGFEKVKDVFRANWDGYEVGACCSVVLQGKTVVDIWGGYQDIKGSKPWEKDTLVNVFSTTKGMGSLACAILADEGKLDYKAKVVDYWPEFGAQGKQDVTVAQLLSHQAGVCGVDKTLVIEDLYDWEKMVGLLAAQKPHWPPGTAFGYHAVTWGYFPGELIRRITGKSLGAYFREKVADPLKADFHIGLADADMGRVAGMIGPERGRIPPKTDGVRPRVGPFYRVALQNPEIRPFKDASSYAWRRAEIAAANGQANARSIARVYGALAQNGEMDGVRIISSKGIAAATKEEVRGVDQVIGMPRCFARGFGLNLEGMYGPNPDAFGHAGAGGSLGFADPQAQIGFGYAMNQMQINPDDEPRALRLVRATYDCIK
jgi:CubicO group peptidase (beta-lactamase class C family)